MHAIFVSKLETYINCDIIPKGFQINVTANIGSVSKSFQKSWDFNFRRCSKELMSPCRGILTGFDNWIKIWFHWSLLLITPHPIQILMKLIKS